MSILSSTGAPLGDETPRLSPEQLGALLETAIRPLTAAEYGSQRWHSMYTATERLCMHSTLAVREGREDTVTDAIIERTGALATLVHHLQVARAWKRFVLPRVRKHAATHAAVVAYAVMAYEPSLMVLLQACLFKRDAVDAAADVLVDLVDIAADGIVGLVADPDRPPIPTAEGAAGATQLSELETVMQQEKKCTFDSSLHALAVIAHLSHHTSHLPLSVRERLTHTRDVIYLLASLLDRRPWEQKARATAKGPLVTYMYADGAWTARATAEDADLVCKPEALAWMALTQLLLDADVQRRYEITEHRRAALLSLLAQFERNQSLLTQLPFLEHTMRYLLTIQLSDPSELAGTSSGISIAGLVEALPSLEPVSADWPAVASEFVAKHATPAANQALAVTLASVYDWSMLEAMSESDPQCATCGAPATQRCSGCRAEWYCSRPCQIKGWKSGGHKKLCALMATPLPSPAIADSAEESVGGSEDATFAHSVPIREARIQEL
ncbi:hypothetical protein BC828DRAFT_375958 [Blastocladiella britannica]|nr:hypothetical protein BC828DRAFT_375958 [Blastocladiella britannica]